MRYIYQPGFEDLFNHKLDLEDDAGARWFLDMGVDVNAQGSLHWVIGRGAASILQQIIDAGADVNVPHPDVSAAARGRGPLREPRRVRPA